MDKYLVTYEYQELIGKIIIKRTTTKTFTMKELNNIQGEVKSYQDYIKIISCYKL